MRIAYDFAVTRTLSSRASNAASNVISAINRQRFDNATGAGALNSPGVEPYARVYYTANYPDPLGRVVATANYGTNGAASWTLPATIPASSATILVTGFLFDNAGLQVQVTDPMGLMTQTVFDQAARRITLIENYQPGSGPGVNVNKTTQFTYNDDGNLLTLTALNAATGNQVTQWIYGVTPATGSALYSNGLVYEKIYPDGSTPSNLVKYSYNRQGQAIQMIDQAGTTHGYSYDLFGRFINDAVSTFGSGVDTTVHGIQRTYEARGMLQEVTSLGSGSTVLNQVLMVYNSFSQLAQEYQEHSGAVNTSTSLQVAYSYANGSANTVRQTGTTYPDGSTVLGMTYSSTAANALSRADGLTLGGSPLCSYAYLGLGVFVNVTYNAASSLELTAETGGTGDAGDQYTALDRFGRLVETLWQTSGSAALVHSKYGRNQVGGIVWRQDLEAAALSVTTQDNYCWYDGLQQVTAHQQGQLNGTYPNYTGIVGPPQQQEDFGYDATGNWATSDTLSPANTQSRTHSKANEITGITTTPGGSITPAYSAAGNMTGVPINPGVSTSQYALTWDAWNRLVKVQNGSSTVATYAYDGLAHRITKTTPAETDNFYYSKEWQVLEVLSTGSVATTQFL